MKVAGGEGLAQQRQQVISKANDNIYPYMFNEECRLQEPLC